MVADDHQPPAEAEQVDGLWRKAQRKPAYYVGFLAARPRDLPGQAAAHPDHAALAAALFADAVERLLGLHDLVAGGMGLVLQQGRGGQDHSRRAVTALQAMLLAEGLLHRMQDPVSGEALYGLHFGTRYLDCEHRTALHRAAVDVDDAGAAQIMQESGIVLPF